MDSTTIPWDADPHTKTKHLLYQRYFGKWFPIMMRGWGGDLTYAEGFSGPGVYADGAAGSPVIALNSIIGDPGLRTSAHKMRLLFVDHNPRCTALLHERLSVAAQPVSLDDLPQHGITVDIRTGECVPTLEQLLTEHNAWGRPMLVVLDTWGGSVPLELVRRVANNVNSEVLITIGPQYFSRFARVDEISHGDAVFGSSTWREVMNKPPGEKSKWLLQHYRDIIQGIGFDHVLDFELIDTRGQSLYLVFATTHERGLEKMKEAMWEVDDISGVGYRDPRDPGQQTLEIEFEPNTNPLRRLIVDHLKQQPNHQASVSALRSFALFRTVYKASHVMPILRDMVDNGELVSDTPGRRLGYDGYVRLSGTRT
ncbi:three-Cys-motif partner protein TcmP [Mycolicibacterium farcinogenes]|uniref:three-Cys-motif partner protein TcmP n=1 Tax=Mycobacteriaceae TaxID=1762 RepID=UPI0007FD4D02|nr:MULTISPECIES: three-Cys-motif partner protein TcmP [Mycobacteriaceae]OBG88664.1 hypothetical protein A5699_16310 [Mycobacterium sp. E802]QZH59229.1 three-Cys-motif partner protein TcmP [Mycolicibacterium farcinogenes]